MKGIEFLNSLSKWQDSTSSFAPLSIPKKLLNQLDNPQDKYKTIHVAGTNGKGTTCALFAEVLKQEGHRVGLFTSPHLIDVTERCRVNSIPIEEEKFNDALCKIAELVNWDSKALTYFVATAIASFLCFKNEEVDYGVIEVGLGGLYDATNVIKKPELTVITSIGLDHTDVLGKTIEEITKNKAGIIKQDVPLILGNLPSKAYSLIKRVPLKLQVVDNYNSSNLILNTEVGKQAVNIVYSSKEVLNFSELSFSEALRDFSWPGRMELKDNILIDGAHNLAALKTLFNEIPKIKEQYGFEKQKIFITLKKREGWKQCLEFLSNDSQFVNDIVFIDWEQGVAKEEIASVINKDFKFIDINKCSTKENDTLHVFTGSLYFVSKLL